MAFPILPYELFFFLPIVFAYYVEKPTVKITMPRLIVTITYVGGIYGGLVHYIALLSVLSGILTANPGINQERGICTALPSPVGTNQWCILLSFHVFFAVPMGTWFLWRMRQDKNEHGAWLTWNGNTEDEKPTAYFRSGFFFTVLGFSGLLPYFGLLADIGGAAFDGTGVYAGTTWANWYEGRGYVEFLSYTSWIVCGLYFCTRYYMSLAQLKNSGAEAMPLEA